MEFECGWKFEGDEGGDASEGTSRLERVCLELIVLDRQTEKPQFA